MDASALLDSLDADKPEWMDGYGRLAAEYDLVAPSLLSYEVGNVIFGRRAKHYGRSAAERIDRFETLLLDVELREPTSESRASGADVAQRYGLTFYDAAYLELAAGIPESLLVSHDAGLIAAARKALGLSRAKALDDF